jgi:hypothetical protein
MLGEGLVELASSLGRISPNRVRTWSFFPNFLTTRCVTPLFLVEINLSSQSAKSRDALSHRNLTQASAALMRNFGSSLHMSSMSGLSHSNPRYFYSWPA